MDDQIGRYNSSALDSGNADDAVEQCADVEIGLKQTVAGRDPRRKRGPLDPFGCISHVTSISRITYCKDCD